MLDMVEVYLTASHLVSEVASQGTRVYRSSARQEVAQQARWETLAMSWLIRMTENMAVPPTFDPTVSLVSCVSCFIKFQLNGETILEPSCMLQLFFFLMYYYLQFLTN